jgi:hypothetical protein
MDKEPGPAYVHDLPRCEDEARVAHVAVHDCTFVYGGFGFGPSSWLDVRFSPRGARPRAHTVVIDLYSPDRTELDIVTEKDVRGYDYPFLMDVTGEGGDDIFVPVARADGSRFFSVWLSDFLNDYYHHTGAYVHAGEIPLGRVLRLDGLGRNLFLETSSGFEGPWNLTLFRARPSGIEAVANLVADGDSKHCEVTGAGAPLLKQLPVNQLLSICGWFSAPRDYYDKYGQALPAPSP